MGILDDLTFVKKAPVTKAVRTGASPLDKARKKLLAEIDAQIELARDPSYVIRTERKKRDGTVQVLERKPKSWVMPGDRVSFITIRFSNKPMPLGGKRGSIIKCGSDDVVAALSKVREWATSNEADETIERMMAQVKRKPRSKSA